MKHMSAVQEMEARYTALEEEHHGLATEKAKLQANSESCVKASCCSCTCTHLQFCDCCQQRSVTDLLVHHLPGQPLHEGCVQSTAGADCFQEGVS